MALRLSSQLAYLLTWWLQMTWYIGVGEDMHRDQKIRFPFFRNLDKDFSPSDLIFTDNLIECSDQ